jgi:hypothetical protein
MNIMAGHLVGEEAIENPSGGNFVRVLDCLIALILNPLILQINGQHAHLPHQKVRAHVVDSRT